MVLHVSSTCAHRQEVKIAHVLIIRRSKLHYTASGITPISVMIPEAV